MSSVCVCVRASAIKWSTSPVQHDKHWPLEGITETNTRIGKWLGWWLKHAKYGKCSDVRKLNADIMINNFIYRHKLFLYDTHFTEREKSPGALSLSLIRKAPSCLCLLSISSALARGIFPKNHLEEQGYGSKCERTDDRGTILKRKHLTKQFLLADVNLRVHHRWTKLSQR